jgi:energy-converting hydrogenase B subunit D
MILEIGLLVFVGLTVAVIESRDLLWAVIFMAGADAVLAMLFFMMSAPDVAITQVSIVGGLSTLIFLIVIRKTGRGKNGN